MPQSLKLLGRRQNLQRIAILALPIQAEKERLDAPDTLSMLSLDQNFKAAGFLVCLDGPIIRAEGVKPAKVAPDQPSADNECAITAV